MWWRLTQAQFQRQKGARNKAALHRLVRAGTAPGLLAYLDGTPVGWCAVGPREGYPRLQRSRVLKPVDEQPVWAVVCFYIARPFRRRGLTVALLKAACRYARTQGARLIEGYPVAPRKGTMPDVFAYTGLPAAFAAAGFHEVLRRSPTRPIMRRRLR